MDASGNFTASTVVIPFTSTGTERYVNSAFANFNRQFGMFVQADGLEGGFKADSQFTLKGTTIGMVTGAANLTFGAGTGGRSRIWSNAGIIEFGFAQGATFIFNGTIQSGTYTVATLPSASANARAAAFVTDSSLAYNSTNLGSTVTAGGSNLVPVWSNGTNWVIG
jgi:hypothetical protein